MKRGLPYGIILRSETAVRTRSQPTQQFEKALL